MPIELVDAMLAIEVMSIIISSNRDTKLSSQKSLSDEIVDLLNRRKAPIESKINQMFCSGIPKPVYNSQDRTLNASILQTVLDVKQTLLIFRPTHTVTNFVFRHIKHNERLFVLTGYPGIGKSISVILYKEISDVIMKFRKDFAKYQSSEIF